jgi:PPOX class probable F420-dependent enzyme
MAKIPESFVELLHKKSYAHIATVDDKGRPQVTPVWIDYDGQYVLVNSAKGRKKDRNLRAHPQVALSILDPDDPYRYLGIQGVVDEITEQGAEAHINKLSRKYKGRDFDLHPGETRVIYKIRPTNVWTRD